MLTRDVSKIGASLRRKQVQYALPIFWNERVQEHQALYLTRVFLCHPADDHAGVAMTHKHHFVWGPWQRERNVLYMLGQRDACRQVALICPQPGKDRCDHAMAELC